MELDRFGTGKILFFVIPSPTVVYTFMSCLVQVKEGTEKRGSIESLVRIVRKTVRERSQSIQPHSILKFCAAIIRGPAPPACKENSERDP